MSSRVHTTAPMEKGSAWDRNPLTHINRLCLIFLQELFKESTSGLYKWDPDPLVTEITITDDTPLDPEVINARPAIVPVRSQVSWNGVSMDQLSSEDLRTGARIHTDLISGNMTFNCLSRDRTEAEDLAWVTSLHFWVLRRILMKLGFHDIGQHIQVMPASPPGALVGGDTEAEIVNVACILPFHFGYSVQVQEQGLQLLQKMETTMAVSMAAPVTITNPSLPGGWGTGLRQVDGSPVRQVTPDHKIRPPSIRGRTFVRTPRPGGQTADPPLTMRVRVEEEE